ncbi:MAG TPA: hypothetical protein VG265_01070 [Gaiellaceae bacterium]|nr:hypothetical protein [Gaiellaceae bacterium]
MARVLSTAFCVALLAATAVAFALTEGAKTERSPIYGTNIPQHVFSPSCNPRHCKSDVADINFKLRKKQHLQVWMDQNGTRVATIVSGKTFPKGEVKLQFTGLADDGVTILPDGSYQPVVRFTDEHRTIRLPNFIELDTTPPRVVKFAKQIYTEISPDHDGRRDVFREPYTLDSAAHAVLIVNGHQAEFTHGLKTKGTLTWGGRIDGHLVHPGRYVLYIAAQDAAGNRSKPFPFAVVTVRFLALGRTTIDVAPNRRFALLVVTDSKDVSWLLDRGRGESRSHTLRIRAPRKRGHYNLFVTASGHTARATVVVG